MIRHDVSRFSDETIYYYKAGKLFRGYHHLGAHLMQSPEGEAGTYFAVWAPNAERASVVGDFNGWDPGAHPLASRWDGSGIWEGFIPGVVQGALYKYHLVSRHNHYQVEKIDPYAFAGETPPKTASVVWSLDYEWGDAEWLNARPVRNSLDAPMSIYELHPGSWRRHPDGNRFLSYRELAHDLCAYVMDMGYTHVELMPVTGHPFYASWGYQTLGYFAATRRYGDPQDLMYLVDVLHQHGIGVILDWVPSHFPTDAHGLGFYDGTHLYEHDDPRKGFHPDWKSYIFNYGRNEVKEFLISSAMFWFDRYHVDGLRVDGVASMLYLDYSRDEGQWVPNEYGGRENVDAINFIKELNETVYANFAGVQMFAEESTDWPSVSRPTSLGGLGFGLKWNMGWMHDTLKYFSKDAIYRKYHHNDLTFSMLYAYTENFVLSISHDEVVHGKRSLLDKMPGDQWQKFANLRLFLSYMFAHPGKKLLFMGCDFGQWNEWQFERGLDWHLTEYGPHQGIQQLMRDLNRIYKRLPAFYKYDFDPRGFEWVYCDDWQSSVVTFVRRTEDPDDMVAVSCNFTPVPRQPYRVGIPQPGFWREIFNSDAAVYGGGSIGNLGGVWSEATPMHGRPNSLNLTIPPLGAVFLKYEPHAGRSNGSDRSPAAGGTIII